MSTPKRPHHWINQDGTCHAGDVFEAGFPAMAVFTAEQVDQFLAQAWNEGYEQAWAEVDEFNEPAVEAIRANPYRAAHG